MLSWKNVNLLHKIMACYLDIKTLMFKLKKLSTTVTNPVIFMPGNLLIKQVFQNWNTFN